MNSRLVQMAVFLLALTLIGLRASAETPPAAPAVVITDFATVATAKAFSIGATGISPKFCDEQLALGRILQSSTGAEQCRKLVTTGTPAGQLYGLVGLKHLHDATYPKVVAQFRFSRVPVIVNQACDSRERPTFFVVQAIEQK